MYIEENASLYPSLLQLNKYLEGHNGFIAGGVFKDIMIDKPARDIDIWFQNSDEFEEAVRYYRTQFNFSFKFENDNAIGFICPDRTSYIELVKKRFGTPTQILDGFDFTVCKMAYYHKLSDDVDGSSLKHYIFHHPSFFSDLKDKVLITEVAVNDAFGQLERILKYSRYGFYPSYATKKLLLDSIHALPEIGEMPGVFDY